MTFRPPKLTVAVVVCVASLAFVAGGCGGDDDSSSAAPAEEWADSFCSALTTWTNDLEAAAEPLSDLSSLSEESIRQAVEEAKSATDTLAESMRSLGPPDTSSGDQVESSVEALATEVEGGAQELEDAVEDVSSVADVPGAVGTITTTLTELGSDVQTLVQSLEDADVSGDLETAFDEADSCAELTNSS